MRLQDSGLELPFFLLICSVANFTSSYIAHNNETPVAKCAIVMASVASVVAMYEKFCKW